MTSLISLLYWKRFGCAIFIVVAFHSYVENQKVSDTVSALLQKFLLDGKEGESMTRELSSILSRQFKSESQ